MPTKKLPIRANAAFRSLPSVDRLLAHAALSEAIARCGRENVTAAARDALAESRQRIAQGRAAPGLDALAESIAATVTARYAPSLRTVINATGVILHTNLGRALLSEAAQQAAVRAAAGYTNLEYDLESGERGSRHGHLESLLRQVTGAEAGLVVNNNAAAVMLGLHAFALGKGVIVSRGEAVEIGGGFRVPEILQQSGAKLVEVGTTNRTYLADFEAAVTPETAAYLRVHPSNFRVSGFTHEPSLAEMASSAGERGILLLHDIGSGCLLETRAFGLAHEPTPQESIAAGSDLVFFSGDKLLGGPQAGIIAGKAPLVQQLKKHPLVRAMRIDKMTLAALQATLLHYATGEAASQIPVWRMIGAARKDLSTRARRWAKAIGQGASVIQSESTIGGGSLPTETLPSPVVAIGGTGTALESLAKRLRHGPTPVVARIERERLVLDPRTVLPEQDDALLAAVLAALAAGQ
ncbi:MAG: L-seryl-tRNA(Sec) selenium transferase [Dehalococcoidia bacterium]|nr:L-seryl-tRNA(Sec) selenium transferase [Dehalococcoidia bacterium]